MQPRSSAVFACLCARRPLYHVYQSTINTTHLAQIGAQAEWLGDGGRMSVARVQYERLLLTLRLLCRQLSRALLVRHERLHPRHCHVVLTTHTQPLVEGYILGIAGHCSCMHAWYILALNSTEAL
jgi:hypothetical protein